MTRPYVLSFHPMVKADRYRLCAGRELNRSDIALIEGAKAVILPTGCSPALYYVATRHCSRVFPDYRCRFLYPGKTGQIRMFRDYHIPHPRSILFGGVTSCHERLIESLTYPLVVKTSLGGEGEGVYFVPHVEAMHSTLHHIASMETLGFKGFLIQEYIPNEGKDLRVAVIGKRFFAYWRIAPAGAFLHHVARGATIDTSSDTKRMMAGIRLARTLQQRTGINLAGLDIMFHHDDTQGETPLLLEVNYFFGRSGLGGNERYYELLNEAVGEWLRSPQEKTIIHHPLQETAQRAHLHGGSSRASHDARLP